MPLGPTPLLILLILVAYESLESHSARMASSAAMFELVLLS